MFKYFHGVHVEVSKNFFIVFTTLMFKFIQITKHVKYQKKKGLKNKRLFLIHSHFRKYSPPHFIKKAGAALVKTITSIKTNSLLMIFAVMLCYYVSSSKRKACK